MRTVKRGVKAAARHQLAMRALLGDAPILQQVRKQQRSGEGDQLAGDISFGEILDVCTCHIVSPVRVTRMILYALL